MKALLKIFKNYARAEVVVSSAQRHRMTVCVITKMTALLLSTDVELALALPGHEQWLSYCTVTIRLY